MSRTIGTEIWKAASSHCIGSRGDRRLFDNAVETARRILQANLSATDYQAFREHVMSMGSPDPGEQEIDDFVGEDFKAAHPERYPQTA